ncbi:MAG: hypothetical protein V3V96_14430 [Acidiferrobacterales bacterium]
MSDVAEQVVEEVEESPPADVAVEAEPLSPVEPEPAADDTLAGGISEATMARAKGYGLSQDDLQGFDDARLERMFAGIDRRIMQPQVGQVPTGPVAGAPAQARDYQPLKIDFGDDLDESVTKPLKTLLDHLNTSLGDVHSFRQQAASELRAMNLLRELTDFDRFVAGLGEEWTSVYGTGSTIQMDPQSNEFQTRLEVFHGAKGLVTNAATRRQRLGISASQLQSHSAKHWDRIAEMERNKLNGKIDQRRRGSVERPTKGKQPSLSPRDQAIERWK